MNRSRSGHHAETPFLGRVLFATLRLPSDVVPTRMEARHASGLQTSPRWLLAAVGLSLVLALALPNPARAAHSPTHQSVGSFDVNIGVVPAAQAQLSASQMGSTGHGEAARRGDYHLVVSVRDVKSSQVVTNATVRAQVGPLGMSTQTKSLDAMIVNGEASYGNYFVIPGRESYTVHLWIDGPGALGAHSEAVFTLRRN